MKRLKIFIEKAESFYLVLLLSSLVFLSFLQISGRLLFNIGFSWSDPIINHLILWSALAGAVMTTRMNEHISIDIIQKFLSKRIADIVQIITLLFSTLISAILVFASVRFLHDEFLMGPVIISPVRSWVFQIPIPLSFTFIGLRFLLLAITHIKALLKGSDPI